MSAKIPVNSSPKPAKDTVYVDVEDEITTIIDKVVGSKAKLVALVLPKRTSALQSVVNMRLLKRSADNAGKTLVIISKEASLLPLAGVAGLHIAKDQQSKPEIPPSPVEMPPTAEAPVDDMEDVETAGEDDEAETTTPAKIDYNQSIGELAAAHELEEPEVIALDDDSDLPKPKTPKGEKVKKDKTPKVSVPNFDRFRLMLFGGIGAFILLIVFIFFAIFVLPKATVKIQTSSTPISANLTLNASDKYTTLNESANQIPALVKASDQSSNQSVNATGTQNQGNKASGTVVMTAGACSATVPSDIPAGTGVSSNGLTFITQQAASFSPVVSKGKCTYQSGNVNIIAQKGGSNYNLPANSTFTISGYPSITASNSSSISGGTDNNVTVVSQSDVDNARAKVTSQTSDDFTNKFLKQLDDSGFYVLKSTLKVGDPQVTSTPAVGQPGSTANVAVKITYSVLVLNKSDLTKVIGDTLNDQIDKARQKVSKADYIKDASVTVQNQTGPSTATLNVSETTTAVPIINVASVKKLAAGKKKAEIQAPISNWPGVKNVEVNMSPFWVSKAPKKEAKINVILQQVKE
jgi:hypothetical protein